MVRMEKRCVDKPPAERDKRVVPKKRGRRGGKRTGRQGSGSLDSRGLQTRCERLQVGGFAFLAAVFNLQIRDGTVALPSWRVSSRKSAQTKRV